MTDNPQYTVTLNRHRLHAILFALRLAQENVRKIYNDAPTACLWEKDLKTLYNEFARVTPDQE